jgi:hypothetical protein
MANGRVVRLESLHNHSHLKIGEYGDVSCLGALDFLAHFVCVRMPGKLRTKLRSPHNPNLFLRMDRLGLVRADHEDPDAEWRILKHGKDPTVISLQSLLHGHVLAVSHHGGGLVAVPDARELTTHFKVISC